MGAVTELADNIEKGNAIIGKPEDIMEAIERVDDRATEAVEEVVDVVRNNPKVLAAVGILGLIAGGVGGYFIARKRLESVYSDLATEEIAEAKQFYANLYKVGEDGAVMTPAQVLELRHPEEAAEAVRTYQGKNEEFIPADREMTAEEIDQEDRLLAKAETTIMAREKAKREQTPYREISEGASIHSVSVVAEEPNPATGVQPIESVNVFADQSDETFDYEAEVAKRTPEKPYVITHDEFFGAERDFETASYTWFEMDEVLVDERSQPVANPDLMVGDDYTGRFGSGSKDPTIVYIRNERLEIDFEISKSGGSYVEEVLGMPDEGELKHNDQRDRRRAFRHGDG